MNKIGPFGMHQFKGGYLLPEIMAKLLVLPKRKKRKKVVSEAPLM